MIIQFIVANERIRLLKSISSHPDSHYNMGVLLFADTNELLDGFNFRYLHTSKSAVIKTDDIEKICGALGVPINEPGIESI